MAVECLEEKQPIKTRSGTKTRSRKSSKCTALKTPTSKNKILGERGEKCAALYLQRHNFSIIETNWRCKFGEADIIAIDEGDLVFVEVKTRSSGDQGFPSEAVDKKKRDKYEKIALCYLERTDYSDMPVRFDVVSVVRVDENRALLRHHVNAFGVN